MTSLLVVHPFLPSYRRPFFDRVDTALGNLGWDFGVVDSDAPPSISGRGDRSAGDWVVPTRTRWVPVGNRALAYRHLRRPIKAQAADLVVVEQGIRNLESYPLLARQHLGGPGVAMWGHGRSYSTPQGPRAADLKQYLTRRSQWFFAYTQAGADHVIANGFPATRVSVLNNTIDTDSLRHDLDAVSEDNVDAFVRRHGLTPGRTALFLGGVDEAKGIDFLLESARSAAQLLSGFVLLVGGAGAQLADVQSAEHSGAPVRALGRLDGAEKALALRSADVLAIPEWIGLVAVDSLVAGRPIVSTWHPSHSPEHEYLEHGTTAVFAQHHPRSYAQGLVNLLADNNRVQTMQEQCVEESAKYGLGQMVDSFVEGVLAWDDVRRAGL
jgi:glycosyltransferase involved in cell wall biosynthesis